MISIIKEVTITPEEMLWILEDFKELTADELPSDLSPMQDKSREVKVFNVREDVMVFICKDRFLFGTYSKLQEDDSLYQKRTRCRVLKK